MTDIRDVKQHRTPEVSHDPNFESAKVLEHVTCVSCYPGVSCEIEFQITKSKFQGVQIKVINKS